MNLFGWLLTDYIYGLDSTLPFCFCLLLGKHVWHLILSNSAWHFSFRQKRMLACTGPSSCTSPMWVKTVMWRGFAIFPHATIHFVYSNMWWKLQPLSEPYMLVVDYIYTIYHNSSSIYHPNPSQPSGSYFSLEGYSVHTYVGVIDFYTPDNDIN